MALFVYVCEECWQDAQEHSLTTDIVKFQERVEATQSTSNFDPFPPPCLVKKKLGGRQGRLIADARHVDEHTVIVFLAIMIRGGHAYEAEFSRDTRAYWEQHFEHLVSTETLRAFVEERTRLEPPPEKPKPSDDEYALLYDAFSHRQADPSGDMVCETREWVDLVTQERIAKQLALLYKPCLDALSLAPGLHFIPAAGKPGWGVWALRSPDRLLLIIPSTDANADEAMSTATRIAEQLGGKDAASVLRASRRAYPALILADDELWIDLEKDPIANMALSPEESEVLESARRSPCPFPLFINGRAGSGKSTILQYLFADLLFFHLTHSEAQEMAPPLYLTANGELLRVARSFVERLLKGEAIFTPKAGSDLARENRSVLDAAFREFHPHVLSLVPSEERSARFARVHRVDYARFRRLWAERFGKEKLALRDYGPDLSWHVIRSYIKGMSSETYLEPQDYAQLPENQITVTTEAFGNVFERVWKGWYEHESLNGNLWDDQDLTRYVLEQELAQPLSPAIVCDEAQDFTRLELELLLRLSLFSNRLLSTTDIRRVPFAFAGDQFQTLNPTGFRWDSIKASFVEKFVFELSPASRAGKVELNYRELEYNYRSTHKIVRFGNHVQALRAALFELPDVRPQTPWSTETRSFPVVWFRADDATFWKKFRDNPGFVVLVPCNEGEEAEYVQRDPHLREHVRFEDGIPVNVLSAARAKGCEYPATIVYGFGEAIDHDLIAELDAAPTEAMRNRDKALPIQYFVNRLYVAVSRPKRRLIIVDTDAGLSRVWRFAQDPRVEARVLERIKNGRAVWGDLVEGMTLGDVQDVTRESAGDPLENAKAFENDGLSRNDAFLLRQAAQAYRSIGDSAKANECRARAYEAEGEYLEAGDAFFAAGFPLPDGLRCLWRAGQRGWSRLLDWHAKFPLIQGELEFEWARAALQRRPLAEVIQLLNTLARRTEDAGFAERCVTEAGWREGLTSVLAPVAAAAGQIPEQDLAQIVAALDRLRARHLQLPASAAASFYFGLKRYPEALALWEASSGAKPKEYYRAKAAIEPYPSKLLSLQALGLQAEICLEYDAAPGVTLSPEHVLAVVGAMHGQGRQDEAVRLAWDSSNADALLQLALETFTTAHRPVATQALHASIITLVAQGRWELVLPLAVSADFKPSEGWGHSRVREWVKSEAAALQYVLIRSLARADNLGTLSKEGRRKLVDFLKRTLLAKGATWKGHLLMLEAGSAFERLGRFTETIGFYNTVLNGAFDESERSVARERRLLSKALLLRHERAHGPGSKAREVEHEIKQELAALRLKSTDTIESVAKLDPLALPPLKQVAKPAVASRPVSVPSPPTVRTGPQDAPVMDVVLVTVGPFRVEHSRLRRRTNLTHVPSMTTAFVKHEAHTCGGEVLFEDRGAGEWVCGEWQFAVRFAVDAQFAGSGWDVELDFRTLGVQLRLWPTGDAAQGTPGADEAVDVLTEKGRPE